MKTYLKGYLRVRLTGYGPERFLNMCQHHQIAVWGLTCDGGVYEFYMYQEDFHRCRLLAHKTKTRLHIMKKAGLPFLLFRYRRRKAFFLGILLSALMLWQLSVHIWDIRFTGNYSYTDDMLMELLNENEIVHGMKKNRVSCAQIEQLIRDSYTDITWVFAQVSGTRLLIQIKENSGILTVPEEDQTPCDLVASKNGIITEIVTRRGVPQVKIGDVVQEGQVLVSGTVPVMNDSQEVVRYEQVRADADVVARTATDYADEFPTVEQITCETGRKQTSWYVQYMGKKLGISFGKADYAMSDRRDQEYRLKLLNDWYLPVGAGVITVNELEVYEKKLSEQEAYEKFQKNLNDYFEKCEEKGVQILENHATMTYNADVCVASGKIVALEPITLQQEITVTEEMEQPDELNGDDH